MSSSKRRKQGGEKKMHHPPGYDATPDVKITQHDRLMVSRLNISVVMGDHHPVPMARNNSQAGRSAESSISFVSIYAKIHPVGNRSNWLYLPHGQQHPNAFRLNPNLC